MHYLTSRKQTGSQGVTDEKPDPEKIDPLIYTTGVMKYQRLGEVVDVPRVDGEVVRAKIVDPCFYDRKGAKQDV